MSTSQSSPSGPSFFFSARQAFKRHVTGSNVLILATIAALFAANLPGVRELYADFWNQPVRLQIGEFNIFAHSGHPMSMLDFVNDALMVVFFFTVGLEIKREVLVGELSSFKQALLPIMGACGGMIVPVLIFFAFAHGTDYQSGSAIPMATDIAFSLGVLAMLGKRVPVSLKIFLTTLAVADDIGGIIVIAVFYSTEINTILLLWAAACLCLLLFGYWFRIMSKMYYITIGAVVWFLFLNSGIHPTIAGVIVAFCIPATPVVAPCKYVKYIRDAIAHFHVEDDCKLQKPTILSHEQMDYLKQIESASDKVISPLQELEDTLNPVTNYIIVPVFAFANAGIFLLNLDPISVFEGISLAIICGLVIGKFVGIFLFSWLTIKLGLAPMPSRSTWPMLASVAMLGGIGFTVSLFIANLSFAGMGAHGADLLDHAKLGIVVGSLLSGIIGYMMMRATMPKDSIPD